jgi:hypothetical protein
MSRNAVIPSMPGHHHVEQDQVGRAGGDALERLEAVRRRVGLESQTLEFLLEVVDVERLIVDDQDPGRWVGRCGHARPVPCASGKSTVNVDPTPSRLSTAMLPPSASARRREIVRPRPVPLRRRAPPVSARWDSANTRSSDQSPCG